MYKCHVHSAIGRGRPLNNDLSRVTEGIATSLRQFSISLSRAAEEGDVPRITRAQRSADAVKEVASLAPKPPKGIDARALAAKPPKGFTIRRVDEGAAPYRGAFRAGGRGGYQGQRGRGGAGIPGGTGARSRGRGAARGGRGRGARGKRTRAPHQNQNDEDEKPLPFTGEELAYLTHAEGGWPSPYIPKTSLDYFAGEGPAVISSPRGAVETAIFKMQVATDNINSPHTHAKDHLLRIERGNGTLFESDEAKAVTQAFLDERRRQTAEELGLEYEAGQIGTLSASDRTALSKAWIAGQYVGPKPVQEGDVIGQVEAYAIRNETYLPEDSRQLQAKLRSLLPASTEKPVPRPVRKSI